MRWLPLLALCLLATRAAAAPCPADAACKCGILGVEDTFAGAESVFAGVVLRVGEVDTAPRVTVGEMQMDSAGRPFFTVTASSMGTEAQPVTLRVSRAWKGAAPGDTVVVDNWPVCGPVFLVAREYLVYAAADEEGKLRPHGCLRTRELTPPGETRPLITGYTWEDMAVLDSLVRARRP